MLKTVYDESTMGKCNVFKWHKCFREGRETMDIEVGDQNNVDLLLRHQEYHPLLFPKGPLLITHST
jgi:hypothetical protein